MREEDTSPYPFTKRCRRCNAEFRICNGKEYARYKIHLKDCMKDTLRLKDFVTETK